MFVQSILSACITKAILYSERLSSIIARLLNLTSASISANMPRLAGQLFVHEIASRREVCLFICYHI